MDKIYEKVIDMKRHMGIRVCLILAGALALVAAATPADYKVVNTWKLGGDGGWDYLTADSEGHRLFISRATRVMVIDTKSGKQIGEIPDTAGVHGIALDPDDGKDQDRSHAFATSAIRSWSQPPRRRICRKINDGPHIGSLWLPPAKCATWDH